MLLEVEKSHIRRACPIDLATREGFRGGGGKEERVEGESSIGLIWKELKSTKSTRWHVVECGSMRKY